MVISHLVWDRICMGHDLIWHLPIKKSHPLPSFKQKKSHGAHDQIMFFWGVSKGYKLNGLLHKTIILVEIYFINNSGGLLFYWSGLTSTGFILFCSPATEKNWDLAGNLAVENTRVFFFQTLRTHGRYLIPGKHPAGGLVVDFFFCRTELRICVAFKSGRNLNVETERSRSVPSSRFWAFVEQIGFFDFWHSLVG